MSDEDEFLIEIGDLRCSGSTCEILNCFWKIDKFSSLEHSVGEKYECDSIPCIEEASVSWFLELYPGGTNDEHRGAVQCVIVCENNQTVNLLAKISFSLRNSNNEVIVSKEGPKWNTFHPGRITAYIETPRRTVLAKLKDDDTVVIDVEIIYTRTIAKDGSKMRYLNQASPFIHLANDYANLPEMMETDTVIVVGDEELHVHRDVLIARSKVFAAMFRHDTLEKETGRIVIVNTDVNLVDSMVEFMYCGTVRDLHLVSALDLIKIGDKYQVDSLISYCTTFLTAQLDESNLVKVLSLTDFVFGCDRIRAQAIEHICEKVSADDLQSKYSDLEEAPDAVFDAIVRMKELRNI